MHKHILYLVGQISADPRSYEWRQKVRILGEDYMDENPQYNGLLEIIDPCANSFNQRLISAHNGDEKSFSELATQTMPLGMLPSLDLGYVKRSTICLANMNHYTPSRPILGSYYELAWYYALCPDKPVIAMFEGDHKQDYQCNHPFVLGTVDVWVRNYNEAMDLIFKQCFC